jgi:folylpolyglutamate synthase/dihydropteroate synthase
MNGLSLIMKELNDEELASLFEEIESANNNEPITFFEILTAAYFSKSFSISRKYQSNRNWLIS